MNDASASPARPPVAIALVHGIGAVHPQDMIRAVTKALEPSLAGAEFYPWIKVIDTPEGIEICQKETRAGPPITIASAYWGDVSRVDEDVFSVLRGLLTNIFGLRFFAAAALRGGGPLRHLLWGTNVLIVWSSAVLMYSLTIVTLVFSACLLAGFYISSSSAAGTSTSVDLAFPATLMGAAILILGAARILAGLWPDRHEKGVYVPLLMMVILFGVVGLLLFTVDYFGLLDLGARVRSIMHDYGTAVKDRRWVGLAASTDPRIIHISFLSLGQALAGILVLLLALLALPLTLLNFALAGFDARVGRATFLALASCVAAWLFVLMVSWPENIVTNLATGAVTKPLAYSAHWVETLLLVFLMLIALVGIALVKLRRSSGAKSLERDLSAYAPPPGGSEPAHSVAPRLIFSAAIQFVLVALMTIAVAIALSHLAQLTWIPQFVPVREAWINLGALTIIVLFVLAAPLFRYGAKTLLDIVDHFTARGDGFPVRKRISARFRRAVRHLVEQPSEKPDLVVISHSQGTVVALDALHDPEFQSYLAPRVRSLTLLTFGSPYEHIYRHYFHADYPGELPKGFEEFAAKVDFRWSNIFRCDDYVGTFVRGSSRWTAENVPLGLGGHVDYWRPEVFERLVKEGRVLRQAANAAAA